MQIVCCVQEVRHVSNAIQQIQINILKMMAVIVLVIAKMMHLLIKIQQILKIKNVFCVILE